MRIILAIVLVIIITPMEIFAVGSLTGDHSIMYNREGTWLCWSGYYSNSRECLQIATFVPVSELDDIAPSARGYVRCQNSHLEMGNIDIYDIKIPADKYIFTAEDSWCQK